jgi:hypothetical protein
VDREMDWDLAHAFVKLTTPSIHGQGSSVKAAE